MDPVLFVLTVFLLLGSLVALEMKDLLSAVIAIGVVGLGLSIVFLLLGAPDIAITQVVVEVIVVTVLILATKGSRIEEGGGRRSLLVLGVGAIALIAAAGFTIQAFSELPAFGSERTVASTFYLRYGPELTGASNVVTAILLDFRAYDTLGEATVILAAIVGVLAVLRRPARRKTPQEPSAATGRPTSAPPAPPERAEVTHG
jgi:multisubunit Na+/H+ antiporter MnhB subunit